MRVKILTSCAGLSFSYYEGEVVEVSAKLGKDLIKAKLAEKTTLPRSVRVKLGFRCFKLILRHRSERIARSGQRAGY